MKMDRTSIVALIGGGLAAVSLAFAGPAAARDNGNHAGAAPGPTHVTGAPQTGGFGFHDPNVHASLPTHLSQLSPIGNTAPDHPDDPANPNGGL